MTALRCPARHMPAEWTPPAPAWRASMEPSSGALAAVAFTVEGAGAERAAFARRLADWFDDPLGPAVVERGDYAGRSGARGEVTLAYWPAAASFDAWREKAFDAWWSDDARLTEGPAYAIEAMQVPRDRMETIFGEAELAGAARTADAVVGPVFEHLYWGSMRDRIPASASDPLASMFGHNLPDRGTADTRGRRLIVSPPANLCVIRSGQNWAACDDEELALYDRDVRPALHAGMRHLRDHRAESGCLDMRFATESGPHGPLKRAFGLGFFLSLGHLEAWAAHHPTHIEIFERMVALATTRGDNLALRLWHEVFVLPSEGQRFEYLNCAPEFGLLPFFPAEEQPERSAA